MSMTKKNMWKAEKKATDRKENEERKTRRGSKKVHNKKKTKRGMRKGKRKRKKEGMGPQGCWLGQLGGGMQRTLVMNLPLPLPPFLTK